MGGGRRREEEKLCPLCIEVLDVDEKSHFPCPCGYQVCIFCLDRLKKEYGNRCPGCRTEYGSNIDPFAKRAPSGGDVVTPASGSSPSSSPAAAPVAATPQSPAQNVGLTPLEQARHMHRAAQHAKRQTAAAQSTGQSAAPRSEPMSATAQQQQRRPQQQQQQQPRAAAPQLQQLTQQPLASTCDAMVQPPRSLTAADADWAGRQLQQQTIGSGPAGGPTAHDTSTLPPAEWQGLGSSFASGGGGTGSGAPDEMLRSSGDISLGAYGATRTADAMHHTATGSGSGSGPWGNGLESLAAGGQPDSTGGPRRTAVPLRPLPLEGGPVAAADPRAEAELARARLAVQCGKLSASDAAWQLLSARTSLRTA